MQMEDNWFLECQELPVRVKLKKSGGHLIGRGDNCDISCPLLSVSRIHCVIIFISAGYPSIYAFKTGNGTYVNHQRIEPFSSVNLHHHDVIGLGPVTLYPDQCIHFTVLQGQPYLEVPPRLSSALQNASGKYPHQPPFSVDSIQDIPFLDRVLAPTVNFDEEWLQKGISYPFGNYKTPDPSTVTAVKTQGNKCQSSCEDDTPKPPEFVVCDQLQVFYAGFKCSRNPQNKSGTVTPVLDSVDDGTSAVGVTTSCRTRAAVDNTPVNNFASENRWQQDKFVGCPQKRSSSGSTDPVSAKVPRLHVNQETVLRKTSHAGHCNIVKDASDVHKSSAKQCANAQYSQKPACNQTATDCTSSRGSCSRAIIPTTSDNFRDPFMCSGDNAESSINASIKQEVGFEHTDFLVRINSNLAGQENRRSCEWIKQEPQDNVAERITAHDHAFDNTVHLPQLTNTRNCGEEARTLILIKEEFVENTPGESDVPQVAVFQGGALASGVGLGPRHSLCNTVGNIVENSQRTSEKVSRSSNNIDPNMPSVALHEQTVADPRNSGSRPELMATAEPIKQEYIELEDSPEMLPSRPDLSHVNMIETSEPRSHVSKCSSPTVVVSGSSTKNQQGANNLPKTPVVGKIRIRATRVSSTEDTRSWQIVDFDHASNPCPPVQTNSGSEIIARNDMSLQKDSCFSMQNLRRDSDCGNTIGRSGDGIKHKMEPATIKCELKPQQGTFENVPVVDLTVSTLAKQHVAPQPGEYRRTSGNINLHVNTSSYSVDDDVVICEDEDFPSSQVFGNIKCEPTEAEHPIENIIDIVDLTRDEEEEEVGGEDDSQPEDFINLDKWLNVLNHNRVEKGYSRKCATEARAEHSVRGVSAVSTRTDKVDMPQCYVMLEKFPLIKRKEDTEVSKSRSSVIKRASGDSKLQSRCAEGHSAGDVGTSECEKKQKCSKKNPCKICARSGNASATTFSSVVHESKSKASESNHTVDKHFRKQRYVEKKTDDSGPLIQGTSSHFVCDKTSGRQYESHRTSSDQSTKVKSSKSCGKSNLDNAQSKMNRNKNKDCDKVLENKNESSKLQSKLKKRCSAENLTLRNSTSTDRAPDGMEKKVCKIAAGLQKSKDSQLANTVKENPRTPSTFIPDSGYNAVLGKVVVEKRNSKEFNASVISRRTENMVASGRNVSLQETKIQKKSCSIDKTKKPSTCGPILIEARPLPRRRRRNSHDSASFTASLSQSGLLNAERRLSTEERSENELLCSSSVTKTHSGDSGISKKKLLHDRKEKLKAISEKQMKMKQAVSETKPKCSSTSLKVKVTPKNRGSFLTEPTPEKISPARGKAALKKSSNRSSVTSRHDNVPSTQKKIGHSDSLTKTGVFNSATVNSFLPRPEMRSTLTDPRRSDEWFGETASVSRGMPSVPSENCGTGVAFNFGNEHQTGILNSYGSHDRIAPVTEPSTSKTQAYSRNVGYPTSAHYLSATPSRPLSSCLIVNRLNRPRKTVQFRKDEDLVQVCVINGRQDSLERTAEGSCTSVSGIIHAVCGWRLRWIQEQKLTTNLPPVFAAGERPLCFSSHEEYSNELLTRVLIDIWGDLFRTSEDEFLASLQATMLVVIDRTEDDSSSDGSLMAVHCRGFVDNPRRGCIRRADLVVVEFEVCDGQEKSQDSPSRVFFSTFAVVHSVQVIPVNNRITDDPLTEKLGAGNATCKLYIVLKCKSKAGIVTGRPIRLKTMISLQKTFSSFAAIQSLSTSPLCGRLLDPLRFITPYVSTAVQVMGNNISWNLTPNQQDSIATATYTCMCSGPSVSVIQGAPGSGKTTVILSLILQLLYGRNNYSKNSTSRETPRILLCAPSDAAVDEVAGRLLDVRSLLNSDIRFKMVRVGTLHKMHQALQNISLQHMTQKQVEKIRKSCDDGESMRLEKANLDARKNSLLHALESEKKSRRTGSSTEAKLRDVSEKITSLDKLFIAFANGDAEAQQNEAEKTILLNADIIATTLAECAMKSVKDAFSDRNCFSCCIIDDASQTTEPSCLLPVISGIKRMVLVGNLEPMLPFHLTSEVKQFEMSGCLPLLTRVSRCFENLPQLGRPPCVLFNQFRVHPVAWEWVNSNFYNGSCPLPVDIVPTHRLEETRLRPLVVLRTPFRSDRESYRITEEEISFVDTLVRVVAGEGTSVDRMVVITSDIYQVHQLVKQLKPTFPGLEVCTLERKYNQEKDVTILSCFSGNQIFAHNVEQLCIALTRAKKSLILCGNFKSVRNNPLWRSFLEFAADLQCLKLVGITSDYSCLKDVLFWP